LAGAFEPFPLPLHAASVSVFRKSTAWKAARLRQTYGKPIIIGDHRISFASEIAPFSRQRLDSL
jgi:hypothetical protein